MTFIEALGTIAAIIVILATATFIYAVSRYF